MLALVTASQIASASAIVHYFAALGGILTGRFWAGCHEMLNDLVET